MRFLERGNLLVIGLTILAGLTQGPDAGATYACLSGIAGTRILEWSGPTWVSEGVNRAEGLCGVCAGAGTPTQRASCLEGALDTARPGGGDSIRQSYEAELRSYARSALQRLSPMVNGALYQPSASEVTAELNALVAACPGAGWAALRGSTSAGYRSWIGSRDCVTEAACRNASTSGVSSSEDCLESASARTLSLEIFAVTAFQGLAASEALRDGHSAPETIDFADEVVMAPRPSPRPRGPAAAARDTHGLSAPQVVSLGARAASRGAQLEEAQRSALREQLGCPANAELGLGSDGGPVCLSTGYPTIGNVAAHSLDEVRSVLQRVVYRDLARFAVQRVWQAYSVALLSDPSVTGSCSTGSSARSRVEAAMGADAFIGASTSPSEGLSRLRSCFGGDPGNYARGLNQLGLGDRVNSLANAAQTYSCRSGAATVSDSSCPGAGDRTTDPAAADREAASRYRRRVEDLHLLQQRMNEFRGGRFRVNGGTVSCGSRNCGDFVSWMEGCAPDYRVSAGCLPPDALNSELSLAWTSYRNLKETENHILSHNPELAASMTTLDAEGHRVNLPAWQVAYQSGIASRDAAGTCPWNGGRRACAEVLEANRRQASQANRRQQLDLILNQACDDPEEFAKKLLLGNPNLVREFADQSGNAGIGGLICRGMQDANAEARTRTNLRTGAVALTMALGAAAAIPTGGGSLAVASSIAGAAATVGGIALTVDDVAQAYSRSRFESGLHHGCIGDYARAREASEALDDAVIRAAIDLGIGVGLFAGMTAAEKITELRRLSHVAEGALEAAPSWAGSVERASRLTGRMARAEARAIAEEYELSALSGMTNASGSLTSEGRRTVARIQNLEDMGFSRAAIRQAMGSCTR